MSAPTLPPAAPTRGNGWAELLERPLGRSRGWRPALRLAVRDLRRHPARTAAAAVMVFIPVLLAGIISAVVPALDVGQEERVLAAMGTADAAVMASGALPYREVGGPTPSQQQVADVVGANAVQLGRTNPLQVSMPGGTPTSTTGLVVPLSDPLAAGVVVLTDGRLPQTAAEIAVTPGLADVTGVPLGGTLTVADEEYTVVGVALERYGDPTTSEVVALPDALPAPVQQGRSWWLLPTTAGVSEATTPEGLVLYTRDGLSSGPATLQFRDLGGDTVFVLSLVAAIVVLQIALLAGPAFAVAARQQERSLAVLSVTGADGRALRQVVLAQAALVGVLAAVLGAAAGAALGAVTVEAARYQVPVRLGPGGVAAWGLLAAVAVGVVASVAAALVPALVAARRAGAAHGPSRRLDRRLPVVRPTVGVGIIVLAAVYLLRVDGTQTIGPVAAVLAAGVGMVLFATLPVALLGRLPHGTPTALRLAARESSRAGTRTVAAAGAVAGATAALVATLCVSAAYSVAEASRYQPATRAGVATVTGTLAETGAVDTQLVTAVRQAVPGATVGVTGGLASAGFDPYSYAELSVRTGSCPEPFALDLAIPCSGDWLGRATGDIEVLDPTAAALQPYALSEEELAHLRSGGVLIHEDTGLTGPTMAIAALVTTQQNTALGERTTSEETDAVVAARAYRGRGAPALVIPEAVARDLGAWFPETVVVDLVPVFDTTDPVARSAAAEATEQLRAGLDGTATAVQVEVGYVDRQRLVQLLVTSAAALVVLVATFTATALALQDGRRDTLVLSVLGASPALRRRVAAATAVIISSVGLLVGVLAGGTLGLASAYRLVDQAFVVVAPAVQRRLTLLETVPWGWLALLLVGLPLVAGLAVAAVSGRPPRTIAPTMRGVKA